MPPASTHVDFPDDAFHMVTQKHWEDDIIWNGEDVKQEVMQVTTLISQSAKLLKIHFEMEWVDL